MLNKTSTLILVAILATTTSFAQLRNIVFEPVEIHSGTYADGINLDGYITFDMYAYMTNETDILEKIYSIDEGTPGDLDDIDTHFNFLGNVFQHEQAGHTGAMNDCNLWAANPSMQFDSYLTFDDTTMCAIDNPFNETFVIPDAATVINTFEGPLNGDYFDGGNFWMDDGELWRVCDPNLPSAGPDLKVRIARITTNNSFSGYMKAKSCCFNTCTEPPIDSFCQDTIIIDMDTTFVMCTGMAFNCNFDCFPNDIDNTVLIEENIMCYGGTATLAIGNGETPYSIDNTFTGESMASGSTSTTVQLGFGCYSIFFEDDSDCVAAGATCLFEPPPLEVSAEGYPTSCAWPPDGGICVFPSGGTPPYTFSNDYYGGGSDCMFGLPCGTFLVTVTDANGCEESVPVDVPCGEDPPQIQVLSSDPESCPGACDGSFDMDVFGGYNWTVSVYDQFGGIVFGVDGGGWTTFTVDNLCAGSYDIEVWQDFNCSAWDFVVIDTGAALNYDVVAEDASCPEACNGSITITPTDGMNWTFDLLFNGNSAGSYSNVSAGDVLFIEDLCPGDYQVIPSNDNGCAPEEAITVGFGVGLEFELILTDNSCFGSCEAIVDWVPFNGSAPYTLTCMDDAGAVYDPFALCDGDYNCILIDENGCVGEMPITISSPGPITATFVTTADGCGSECTGSATFDIQGGSPPFYIECEDGTGGVFDPEFLCSGEFDCAIIDVNGCQYNEIVVIESESIVQATIATQDATCFGICDGLITMSMIGTSSGEFEVTCTGGTPIDTGGLPAFGDLCVGEYFVTVTDPVDGCSVEFGPYVILEPAPLEMITTVTDVTCAGESDGSITIDCLGGNPPVFIDPPGQECPVILTDLAAGEHVFVAIDAFGCTTDLALVVDEPQPIAFDYIVFEDCFCGDVCTGFIEFGASGGTGVLTFLLDDQPVEAAAYDLCPGDYALCAYDINGCALCEVIAIGSPPALQINVQTEMATCEGMKDGSAQVLVLGGTGEYDLEFLPEESDPNNLSSGDYQINVTDESQCFTTHTFTIENEFERFLIDVVTTPETCWNTKDGLASAHVFGGTEPYLYQWNDPLEQVTPIAHSLEAFLDYRIEITDGNGCIQNETITFDASEGCFFVSTGITPNGDGSNDRWLIGGLDQFPEATVQVYSRWGNLIFESQGYNDPWDGTYKNRKVPVADYYYVISYQDDLEPLTGTVTVKY